MKGDFVYMYTYICVCVILLFAENESLKIHQSVYYFINDHFGVFNGFFHIFWKRVDGQFILLCSR